MKYLAALAAATIAVPLAAQTPAPPKPKLIVAISVDQLSSDLFNEYRARFTGGLKRLASGVVFPRGHQGHAATETCPGHSTILTGSRPARTGIIANDWQNPRMKRGESFEVYCSEDESVLGSTSSSYTVSPIHLKVPTLGDRLKAITPSTRVVAVSGKDRGAVMMGGHKADLTLWWDGKAFATYKDNSARLPAALPAINARAAAGIARPAPLRLPPSCLIYSRAVATSATTGVGRLKPLKPGDGRGWRATPQFDALTTDLALAAFGEMKLGQGAATDVLALSLAGTDYVGHAFGTEGAEMCANMAALDATLGRLFAALDRSRVPYAVVLTADHGGHDLTERNRENGLPQAQRVDAGLSPLLMGPKLAAELKLPGNPLIGRAPFGDVYLAAELDKDQRKRVSDAAVAAYEAHPQVETVFTWAEIMAAPEPDGPVDEWSLLERVKASFDPERSGDLYVILKPYVTPIPDAVALGYTATHGSPWGYDRRVPILFWWKGIAGFEQPNAVETADILPTLAGLMKLPIAAGEIDGRCLDVVAGVGSNCGQAAEPNASGASASAR